MVALAGNYVPEKVLALMEEFFGGWESAGQGEALPPMAPLTGKQAAKEKDTEQLHLCLGFPAPNWAATSCIPCPL